MSNSFKQDYINYRLQQSKETLNAAKLLIDNNFLGSAVNRLYYACFYAVNALLFQHNIATQTHSGTKTQFNLHFIKSGKMPLESGKLFADLFDNRQKGDYSDFYDFEEEHLIALYEKSQQFISQVNELIVG